MAPDSGIVYGAHDDLQTRHFSSLGVIGTLGTADVGGTARTLSFGVEASTGAAYTRDLSLISGINNKFNTNHIDDYTTTSVTYFGKEDSDGVYQIMKIDETGNFPVFTYASISNNPSYTTYTTAWNARTSLTYNIFATAF